MGRRYPLPTAELPVRLTDPSEYRPEAMLDADGKLAPKSYCPPPQDSYVAGKNQSQFRIYDDDVTDPKVRQTYTDMHTHQTVDYVNGQEADWCMFDRIQLNVMDALDLLNEVIDESDPDTDVPNIVHAFQTAERIRECHPDKDWFHLVGLIHDLGKIMAYYGQPQWSTVGDTYVVGCRPASTIVFPDTFDKCPDSIREEFRTELGIYKDGCGLKNLKLVWGHDEYLYRVLVNHGCTIPEEGLFMIRFHSFYPWHTGRSYQQFETESDKRNLEWVREFNKFDLYSKADKLPDIEELKPYYQSLIDKYCPGFVKF